ncbi:diacylglycerol/lipid kinase family protein [Planococcus salinarum]|uniref:diacylglycerol/lipid kinase family protein n=1 Tax=Planococcus salinarum TaxID=622695 RepID=UPI000E3BC405|nr:diacylglycerol kinase family protein [Planococcus salinarum]TAA73627.1 diacylglycerol kinase family lipid kinase [Planococcus salinarum]
MPKFKRSVLLYNAQAGTSTPDSVIAMTAPAIAAVSEKLELIQTNSPEELRDACRELPAEVEALFVAGGDGTIHDAVQALSDVPAPPPLGIIPSGTCNDFARTLSIPMDLTLAAEALVDGFIKDVDAANINGHSFLNFAGIGIITDISTNIDLQLKERYGKLSYFMSGLQSMRQTEPFPIHLTVDGVHYEENGVLALAMNGKSIGTHAFPMDSIDPSDGLLDVFIIQTSSIAAMLEWFSLSKPDVPTESLDHIQHYQGKHINIETESPMNIDTDGEVYLKTPAEIKILPKKLKMFVPRPVESLG